MRRVAALGGGVPVLVLLLAAVVAAASRTRLFHEGEPPLSPAASRLAVDFSAYLFVVVLLVGAAVTVWALWPDDNDAPAAPRRSLRSLLLQLAISMLVVGISILLLVRFRLHQLPGQQLLPARVGGTPSSIAGLAGSTPDTPAPFDWAAAGLVALTVAVIAAVAIRRARRFRRTRAARAALARELEAAVQETLDDLATDADPRLAVIRAYARMERALAVHGVARRPPEAPLEYLARVLGELEVPAPAARRLTELFEEARFSRHRVSPLMRDEAVGCLRRVRSALAT